MPARQESISFPVRRTHSSRTKSKKSTATRKSSATKTNLPRCAETLNCGVEVVDVTGDPVRVSQILDSQHEFPDVLERPRQSSQLPGTPSKQRDTSDSPHRSSRKAKGEGYDSPQKPAGAHEAAGYDRMHFSPKRSLQGRETSPEVSPSSRSLTPTRHSHNAAIKKDQLTPSKRKLLLPGKENNPSPTKKLVVVLNQIPKEYSDRLLSLRSPNSSHKENSPVSPPKTTERGLPLSPVQFYSPSKSAINTKSSLPELRTPHKSPVAPLSTAKPCISNTVLQSPCKSAVKRLNMNSPMTSPLKPLVLASPRRSPRKFNEENIGSPRRSPRKAVQSPLRFSSPSSLVSRLSLTSPSTCRKKLAVGISKPDMSAYRALRKSLNSGTPSLLVCRERQVGEINNFLTYHLTATKPGSLYVSGAPGTGKTASLNSVLETLEIKKMKKVFLNCMTLKTTVAIYKAIVTELGLQVRGSEKENRSSIERALTSAKHPILLMLDEVDQLDNKNQEVLYTIFEWPALAGSTLVLVGIANSLDLTDRILPRLQARPSFKPKLLHFPPYSKAEIVKIINHRISEADLGDIQVIRPAAIQLLAGKVASVAGDVRKALDVCRRAVELCEIQARRQAVLKPMNASPQKSCKKQPESASLQKVEIPQILSIFNEVYGSRVVSAVTEAPESFSLQQKVLICCLLLILKYGRSKDVTLGKFHEVYTRVCKKQNVQGMDQTEFLSLCTLLEARGMLQVKRSKEIRSSKVLLHLNAEEAEETLGDQDLLATILEDRESLGKLNKGKF